MIKKKKRKKKEKNLIFNKHLILFNLKKNLKWR